MVSCAPLSDLRPALAPQRVRMALDLAGRDAARLCHVAGQHGVLRVPWDVAARDRVRDLHHCPANQP